MGMNHACRKDWNRKTTYPVDKLVSQFLVLSRAVFPYLFVLSFSINVKFKNCAILRIFFIHTRWGITLSSQIIDPRFLKKKVTRVNEKKGTRSVVRKET